MLVQLMTAAMNINQHPGPLKIVNVVATFDGGGMEKYPPHGRPRSVRFGITTVTGWVEGATPRATFEQSVVLSARYSANPLVTDVLRILVSPTIPRFVSVAGWATISSPIAHALLPLA